MRFGVGVRRILLTALDETQALIKADPSRHTRRAEAVTWEIMNSIEAVARVIQLAVAPVFLLAGIAGLLGVLSTRLARIVDRARVIERRVPQAKREEQRTLLRRETTVLWRRIGLINWAIRLCIGGALAVCLVIMALFVGALVAVNIAVLVAVLFVLAMILIIAGLLFLLGEVRLSTRQMREGLEIALEDAGTDSSRQR